MKQFLHDSRIGLTQKISILCVLAVFLGCGGSPANDADENDEGGEQVSTYSVQLTVSGLEGSLTLANGGEEVEVTKDGEYPFDAKLPSGTEYDVTVTEAPEKQNCLIENGSGTVGDSDVIDIACNCSSKWTHPESAADAISLSTGEADSFDIAMAANGDAVVVFEQKVEPEVGDTEFYLLKGELRDGKWTKPTSGEDAISTQEGAYGTPNRPFVCMNDQGTTAITYEQLDQVRDWSVLASTYVDGTWMHVTDVMTDNVNFRDSGSPSTTGDGSDATHALCAIDNNDNIIVAFIQDDSSNYNQIAKAEYRDGSWIKPSNIEDNFSVDDTWTGIPYLAVASETGDAFIFWSQDAEASEPYSCNGGLTACDAVYEASYFESKWSSPNDDLALDAFTNPSEYSSILGVSMNASGEAVVGWLEPYNQDLLVRIFSNGKWSNKVKKIDTVTPSSGGELKLHMTDDGQVIAMWSEYQDDITGLYMRKYDPVTKSWSAPESLAPFTAQPDGELVDFDFAHSDSTGEMVLAFVTNQFGDGLSTRAFLGEYRNDAWDLSFEGDGSGSFWTFVDSDPGANLKVEISDTGRALIGWLHWDGDIEQVMVSEYWDAHRE